MNFVEAMRVAREEKVMDDLEKEIRRLYSFPNCNNTDIIAGLLLSLLSRIQELEKK